MHSEKGAQFPSRERQSFLYPHNLEAGMSQRGNCHGNAVVESVFQRLKRERIRRKIYPTRDNARRVVFEHNEPFDNPKRMHRNIDMLSPVDVECRPQKLKHAGAWKIGAPQTKLAAWAQGKGHAITWPLKVLLFQGKALGAH